MSVVSRDPFEPVTDEQREQLRARWPDAQRLLVAVVVARDVEAAADLIRGVPVDRSRLFEDELLAARAGRLAALVQPLDLLGVE